MPVEEYERLIRLLHTHSMNKMDGMDIDAETHSVDTLSNENSTNPAFDPASGMDSAQGFADHINGNSSLDLLASAQESVQTSGQHSNQGFQHEDQPFAQESMQASTQDNVPVLEFSQAHQGSVDQKMPAFEPIAHTQTQDSLDLPSQQSADLSVIRDTLDSAGQPASVASESSLVPAHDAAQLFRDQLKWITNTLIRNLKKKSEAGIFLHPVDPVRLGIPNYLNVITTPMDISTIEKNISGNVYTSLEEVKAHFTLMFTNCFTFNGHEGPIPMFGKNCEAMVLKEFEKMPTTVKAGSKKKKSINNSDSRPKREPTLSSRRNLSTSEMNDHKFCLHVVRALSRKEHQPYNSPFLTPVDPVALGIPHYREIIKQPMDLQTLRKRAEAGEYETLDEFEVDMRLIFANCYTFNPPGSPVFNQGNLLEAAFNTKWAERDSFVSQYGEAAQKAKRSYDGEGSGDEDQDAEDALQIQRLKKQLNVLTAQLELLTEKRRKFRNRSGSSVREPRESRVKDAPRRSLSGAFLPKKDKSPRKRSVNKAKRPRAESEDEKEPAEISYEQKRELSDNINILPPEHLTHVFEIIKNNANVQQGDEEIELDIDSLEKSVLWTLYKYVKKHTQLEKKLKIEQEQDESDFPKQISQPTPKPIKKRAMTPVVVPFRTEIGNITGASFQKIDPSLFQIAPAPIKPVLPSFYDSVLDSAWDQLSSNTAAATQPTTHAPIPVSVEEPEDQVPEEPTFEHELQVEEFIDQTVWLDIQGPMDIIDAFPQLDSVELSRKKTALQHKLYKQHENPATGSILNAQSDDEEGVVL